MHVLGAGRVAFLEFLRNLTPQILLLSLALVVSSKLTNSCCYVENVSITLTAIAFWMLWFLAFSTNLAHFFENYMVVIKSQQRVRRLLMRAGKTNLSLTLAMFTFMVRSNKLLLVEFLFVLVTALYAFVAVGLVAANTARSLLHL